MKYRLSFSDLDKGFEISIYKDFEDIQKAYVSQFDRNTGNTIPLIEQFDSLVRLNTEISKITDMMFKILDSKNQDLNKD